MEARGPNAEQIEYWNEKAAPTWVKQNERLDAMLAPFGLAVIERAQPKPGERVLDVGCGVGQTSLQLAERVGASGSVLGVDISTPMLERARERARAQKLANLRFENADAQTFALTPNGVDLLFSRFGVMFFVDPQAAFANLARAVRPGGRLAFVCWQGLGQNAWMREPVIALAPHVTMPPPLPPEAPGPFAFADEARVRGILERAGFRAVKHEPLTGEILLGRTVDEAVAFASELGPAARVLLEITPAEREKALGALGALFAKLLGPNGIRLGYAAWLVTAER